MSEKISKYLYHYTTLESLAMILKSKKIKFNPLAEMDDPQEQLIKDAKNLGKYVFISSWVDESRESIAMWKLYSDFESGVRIKLKTNPFRVYLISADQISKRNPSLAINTDGIISVVPIDELVNQNYFLTNCAYNTIVEKVRYKDDINALIPTVLNRGEKNIEILFKKVGKYKNTYWDFQNEVRYILRFLPVNLNNLHYDSGEGDKVLQKIISEEIEFELKNYFLEIADNVWYDMEVTLSPMITPGNRECVYALKERYNEKMTIKESELSHLIRR